MASPDLDKAKWPVVSRDDITAFVVRCMEAVGSKKDHAEALAELIMMADYRGHYSHGLNRIGGLYDIHNKLITICVCVYLV